ncbi:hypothetical protein C8R44DRAFT_735942 [Mycena epipterygia]|nr:hypothetical protein C8R44DRAFT_735942 [Mycena epipterygia]
MTLTNAADDGNNSTMRPRYPEAPGYCEKGDYAFDPYEEVKLLWDHKSEANWRNPPVTDEDGDCFVAQTDTQKRTQDPAEEEQVDDEGLFVEPRDGVVGLLHRVRDPTQSMRRIARAKGREVQNVDHVEDADCVDDGDKRRVACKQYKDKKSTQETVWGRTSL